MTYSYDYDQIIQKAVTSPISTNRRTGQDIRVIRGGLAFNVDLSEGLLPLLSMRKLHIRSAAAEVAWFLQGMKDSTWMNQYAPSFWDKFTEDDGKTVANAYGYRWLRHFKRDQIAKAIEALTLDQSDRRVYIGTWDPAKDGLGEPGQKNVPCPVGFTLSLLNGELNSSMLIRSSDLFIGLPYDVLGHALLLSAIANDLGAQPGVMSFLLAHPHLYHAHTPLALEGLQRSRDSLVPEVPFSGWGVKDIRERPDAYVEAMTVTAKFAKWPVYNPKPEVFP